MKVMEQSANWKTISFTLLFNKSALVMVSISDRCKNGGITIIRTSVKNNYYSLLILLGALAYMPPILANDLLLTDKIKLRLNRAAMIPETIQNPGFEGGDTAGQLSGWSRVVHAGDRFYVDLDDSQVFGGRRSLIIKNIGNPSWGGAQQLMRAERMAGREIELTAQAKVVGVTAPGFYVGLKIIQAGGEWNFIKMEDPIIGDVGWKKVSLRTTLPKETIRIEVNLILDGDGSAWVDDVQLDLLPEKQ